MNLIPSDEILIRYAREDDARALRRLAALDSAEPLSPESGRLLVAVVDGELWAALSVADGAAIADPFRPSADVLALLRQRAGVARTRGSRAVRRSLAPTRSHARALRPSRP